MVLITGLGYTKLRRKIHEDTGEVGEGCEEERMDGRDVYLISAFILARSMRKAR